MVNFDSVENLQEPVAALTTAEQALLVAAVGAIATIFVAVIGVVATYFSNKRQARRELYSKAVQAAVAWKEMLYRVRRRTEGNEQELIYRFHDLQDQLSYYQAWVDSDSKFMGRSYKKLVDGVKTATEPVITEAWAEDARPIPGCSTAPVGPLSSAPTTARLDLGGGKTSDANATEVVVKMFLQTWIEGRRADGNWENVTDRVLEWCSTQWLKRTAPRASWAATPGIGLVEGVKSIAEYAKNPDDAHI